AKMVVVKEQIEHARTARVLATVPAPAPALPAAAPPAIAPAAPAPAVQPGESAAPSPPAVPARTSTLGQERIILEEARRRLIQRDARGALGVLDRHERGFPHGQLAEERDSLRVRALAESGQPERARARAAEFRRRYPQSLFLPAVDAAAIP